MTTIHPAAIRLDGGTQPRATERKDWVEEYALEMSTGATFPPVTVFFDGSEYWLADGFHRTLAALSLGLIDIEADIRQGTQRDAILYSVSANASHGQRRTNEDKRRAVLRLIHDPEWGGWSNREIARRVGVDDKTVSTLRPPPPVSPPASAEVPQIASPQPRTVTRNGTTYQQNTANIGRKPTPSDVMPAAQAAILGYASNAETAGEPVTMDGLRGAVRDAVQATLGPPPERPKPQLVDPPPPAPPPIGNDWVDWTAAVETVSSMSVDYSSLARRTPARLRRSIRQEAELALARLPEWIAALEVADVEAA